MHPEKTRFLLFNPGSDGGIVKYGWCQARALQQLGCTVTVLCQQGTTCSGVGEVKSVDCLLPDRPSRRARSKLARLLRLAWQIIANELQLARHVVSIRPDAVLLSSYSEYLSPVWVWLQMAARRVSGAIYVANLHDPVRDFIVGPGWWHELSVRMAYWPLSAVFLHQRLPEKAFVPRCVVVREVPHGLFEPEPSSLRSRDAVRAEWRVPSHAIVLLSFGYIRDGKNIDLLIRALPENPHAWLVVMGRVASASVCKPASFYEDMAAQLGVADRVRIIEGFVADETIPSYLAAADVMAMTYSSSFHSQSGVLNTVAGSGKPVLASSGESPLKECVQRFQLGVFVEPDNAAALAQGMREICEVVSAERRRLPRPIGTPALDWAGYRGYASWETNARVILETIEEVCAVPAGNGVTS